MAQDTKLPNHDEEAQPMISLEEIISHGTKDDLKYHLSQMDFSDLLLQFSRLDKKSQSEVLLSLSPDAAADFLEEIPDSYASEVVTLLTPQEAAPIVTEMESDEIADLLGDIHEENAEAILAEMDSEHADEVRELSTHADDVAGGLMVKEYLAFTDTATVIDVIEFLTDEAIEQSYFEAHIYVTSINNRLVGVLGMRDLLLAHKATKLQEIMKVPRCISVDAPLEEISNFFANYDYFGVPVVDGNNRLVGVVRRRDVSLAITERSEVMQLKSSGIVAGEEMRTMPTLVRSRRRLSWLSINIVLNMISASVIALYTDTLSAVIALAVFLPIVSDMSGCSGNQAVAVSMRELALGLVKPFEVLRVWFQEIKVGVLNGIALGILLGGVAWLWKGNPYLGLVVGLALALNTMVAVSIGGTVPLLLKRMNIDPAVASGPVLTTVTDLCGFFLVLGIATLMLPLLTA